MKFKKFSNGQEFIEASVQALVSVCLPGEKVSIGLSGGSTPRPVYEALAKRNDIDFKNIEFYLVDERCVPFADKNSNYKMISEAFSAAPKFKQHFHYFDTAKSPEDASRAYQAELAKIPGESLDLVILGIGGDGHTASLFPNSPELLEGTRLAAATINENAPNPVIRERLTMTFPMLLKAKRILLLASGADKKAILEDLINSKKTFNELPAKKLLENNNLVIHYLA